MGYIYHRSTGTGRRSKDTRIHNHHLRETSFYQRHLTNTKNGTTSPSEVVGQGLFRGFLKDPF